MANSPRTWLILSHAFNMDGRAASQTITDKIPRLRERGINPVVISAITGRKDTEIEHHQLLPRAPSGIRFDLRHYWPRRFKSPATAKFVKNLCSALIAPFYGIERAFLHREPHWSWYMSAYRRGLKLVRKHKPEVILSTGGASSAHYAGYLLAKKTGLPWLIEVHDPMIFKDWYGSAQAYEWNAYLESLFCQYGDVVWWFTPEAHKRALARHPELDGYGHVVLPGALKPDFEGMRYAKGDLLNISHSGSLSSTRSLKPFLEALVLVFEKRPELRQVVRLNVYGSGLDGVTRKAIKATGLDDVVVAHGRLELDPATGKSGRQRVLEAMRTSDLLLLVHGTGAFTEEYIPSKFYEYLWAQRPILGLRRNNDDIKALFDATGNRMFNEDDTAAIAEAVLDTAARWEADDLPDTGVDSPYTVEGAVDRIVDITDKTLTERGVRPKR
ncbi:MAG: hypothetical protein Q7Q73_07285 [Verrucomicrobiota bacterium JB024]|nr:hypothetical protein [Verrucomicrobiota bacterium JB024]